MLLEFDEKFSVLNNCMSSEMHPYQDSRHLLFMKFVSLLKSFFLAVLLLLLSIQGQRPMFRFSTFDKIRVNFLYEVLFICFTAKKYPWYLYITWESRR